MNDTDTSENSSTATRELLAKLGASARSASRILAAADTGQKNRALEAIAKQLDQHRSSIIKANALDMKNGRDNHLDAALLDRLELDDTRIDAMIEGLGEVAALPDPVGSLRDMHYRPSGIELGKMRVPLGVIGIIYESRPNVTIDAASLCLKSGNAAILRGGKEAINSNRAIAAAISEGLGESGLPREAVQVVETTDRTAVAAMISMPEFIDVIVPRGGKGLIERIANDARVPVIKHLDGNCHVYIDDEADLNMAYDIAINAKTHRYGVCNAMETLLVAEGIADKLLPRLAGGYANHGVELRGCEKTRAIIAALPAQLSDWSEEYLAPILAIKVVANIDEAIGHISQFSSGHTEAIVTENYSRSRQFIATVDSSSVMINASTRFADGFEYGLGAEIGISTDKIHARGPVGLEGLTSEKWVVMGSGQIRQ